MPHTHTKSKPMLIIGFICLHVDCQTRTGYNHRLQFVCFFDHNTRTNKPSEKGRNLVTLFFKTFSFIYMLLVLWKREERQKKCKIYLLLFEWIIMSIIKNSSQELTRSNQQGQKKEAEKEEAQRTNERSNQQAQKKEEQEQEEREERIRDQWLSLS
jgi:hypothetical protein